MLIRIEPHFPEQDKMFIIEKLDAYGMPLGIPRREHEELHISLRNDQGQLQGAFIGYMYWQWLYVEFLWVDPALRGQGYGAKLLAEAESIAQQKSCIGVHLETHDFQAPDFYKSHGYTVVGTIKDLPPGYIRYDMVKVL